MVSNISGTLNWYQIILFILAFLILIIVMSNVLPPAVDWQTAFRPAALEFLSGRSPFNIDRYYNAPWALLPLLPLALLPENIGYSIWVLFTLAALAYTAHQLGAKPAGITLLLLSPPALHSVLNGNIDCLAVLGFVLPPQIGLFFITVKPQIGLGVVVFWLVEAWREGRWRGIWTTFGPITITALISFVIFGLWPLRFIDAVDKWWNASLWPASIPVGIALLVTALRKRRIEFAMGASPCLSPFVLFHAWLGALFAISDSFLETIAAVVGLWIFVLIRVL